MKILAALKLALYGLVFIITLYGLVFILTLYGLAFILVLGIWTTVP